MADLLAVLDGEGTGLVLEHYLDDFIEDGFETVDLIRGISHRLVSFGYCVPHSNHMGGNTAGIME